ncbi:MAG: 4Fe-4S binding protein, partial [Candidatus Thorarchaeota archaeon]
RGVSPRDRSGASGAERAVETGGVSANCEAGVGEKDGYVEYPGGAEDFVMGDWKFMFYFRIVILLVVIGLSVFIPRFYCRYVCPIGYATGFTAKYSLIGIARNPARCTRCGKCEDMCEKTAMQVPILDYSFERVRDANCTNCGNCLDACPHGAIHFKFKG